MGFGPEGALQRTVQRRGLNALTGIDGIWTDLSGGGISVYVSLNALTGIDGIWTLGRDQGLGQLGVGLNALTGIDGIWT